MVSNGANLGYYVLLRCHIKHCTLSVHPSYAFQLLILLIRVRHSSYSTHIFLSNLCSEFSQLERDLSFLTYVKA